MIFEPLYQAPRVVIFDYDGTLSDGTHRLHLLPIKDQHLTETWIPFNAACVDDTPIQDTIDVMNAMYDAGFYVIILTGRSDHVYDESVKWLKDNGARYHHIEMRKQTDNRKDTVIKEEYLRSIGLENIVAAWDDSPNVIEHFRMLGLTVYQVCDYGDKLHTRTDLKSNGVEKL
jgi:hydroxymethylpyrimidine pyrophosphatase-like HAD family hydrolase